MTETKLAAGVYPIPFATPLHKKVIEEFKWRLKMSRDAQRKDREEAWKRAEEQFLAYIPETDLDAARKGNRDKGNPQYTTLAIPYSYAMLLTSHTYYTSVFLSRNPVMQLTGRHGESQNAEGVMEALLDYQLTAGGNLPQLFTWLLDVGKYGYGVLGQYWDKEIIPLTEYVEEPVTFMGVPIPGKSKRELRTRETVGYEGTRLYNIRPQDFYFDPRYPAFRFQEGEYCAVFDRVGWNKILTGKANGRYYNTDKIGTKARGWSDRDLGSHKVTLPGEDQQGMTGDAEGKTPAFVDLHEFYWEIVPSALGLGSSNRPEKWVFTIAGETTIISAMPLGLRHGKFPMDVIPYEIDGYSIYSRSMFEILEPMNQTLEWLLNSHFFNVRASLNNMLVADPSRVVMKDVENPEPGKLIRLKPAAYGSDVRQVLAQLPVGDITRSHLNDMNVIGDLAQRIGGVSDNVMGMINPGGRRTATEVRTSTSFSANRLKTACEWFSAVGWSPLTQKMVVASQQLYSTPRKYRIVGDLAQWGERYLQMNPDEIQGFFDFVPVDGTMPVDRYAQANLWNQMFGTISKMPQIMQQYDIAKLFGYVAQLAGLKNITQFKVQIVPDAVAQQQAQAGNMVALRGNPNEPGQVPSMGPTG